MALRIPNKPPKDCSFASYTDKDLNLERGRDLEWLLPNGLGGYSSSTIIGLNTRKYHGLLVSSDKDLRRFIYLQKLEEEIRGKEGIKRLSCNEYADRTVTEGWKQLTRFDCNYDSVSFVYNTWSADIIKTVSSIEGKNGVVISYVVRNKLFEKLEFRVNLITNSRNIYDETKQGERDFETKIFTENVMGLKSDNGYLTVYSDKAQCAESPQEARWIKNVFYSSDAERKDTCIEDTYFPAYFSLYVEPGMKEEFSIVALGYENEDLTAAAFKDLQNESSAKGRILSSGVASSVLSLLTIADSFIVEKDEKKTVIAGYHWFGEWGRDAMISLPGLTLVRGQLDDARLILEHFLDHAGPKGIPNSFIDGKPIYSDVDSSLWLIDRVHEYMKYAGPEKTREFLGTYWPKLKGIIAGYSLMERDGLLVHESGTWMDTLHRNNAVEIQALWYNALRIMERLADVAGDKKFYVKPQIELFEKNYIRAYWNGKYLDDCFGDPSLRPNQIIAASLDYNMLDEEKTKSIMRIMEKELLTPYGLRTLNTQDERYRGKYAGDFSEREFSYHNGTVWPWLLGPYMRTYMRLGGSKEKMQKFLEPLFERHIKEAGIGTISEIFDGNPPHQPRGCISQAWSVAEPLRAYYEDVMGKKPPYGV
jgi:predicted glycogen debranching enzyme